MAPADGACPACGAAVGSADGFCEACGQALSAAQLSVGRPGHAQRCLCGSAQISVDGYCDTCGRKAPAGRDHVEIDLGVIAGVTDRGVRHPRNEDAMALATAVTAAGPVAVAVVCDGVSTSDRPDEASLAAAAAAARVLLTAARSGADVTEASSRAVGAAADAIAELARDPANAPSATYVSAVITEAAVTVCWVGDSRAYWLPAGQDEPPRVLTTDDSWSADMVAAGLLSEAQALASPRAHVVTRWLGPDAVSIDPHVLTLQPTGPGVVLLCSDGLWNYCPTPAEMAGLALPAALADPHGTAVSLVRFATEAGGQDNITVILAPLPLREPTRTGGDAVLVATADQHSSQEGAR
jgi:serine/threonine protein phosphatase PrpC